MKLYDIDRCNVVQSKNRSLKNAMVTLSHVPPVYQEKYCEPFTDVIHQNAARRTPVREQDLKPLGGSIDPVQWRKDLKTQTCFPRLEKNMLMR